MYNQIMKPAIFLDRDGVIMENRANYVRCWDDVAIFPAAVEILAKLAPHPYLIVLVTNQSVVGRKLISLEVAQNINQRLVAELSKKGCRIDGVFMCPHEPEDQCDCRKPQPGLLYQAATSFQIDLRNSIMIGDAWTDLQAGQAAGVSQLGLVLTGRGQQQLALQRPLELTSVAIYKDLTAALHDMISL